MAPASELLIRGYTVLVTRPLNQSEELCRLIESAGGRAVHYPVIELRPNTVTGLKSRLLTALRESHIAIFVSRNAVRFCERMLPDAFNMLTDLTVLAVGSGTRQELLERGIAEVFYTDIGTSESLLALAPLQPGAIRGKQIVIIQGVDGRGMLQEAFGQCGAKVCCVEVYRRTKPDIDPDVLKNIWQETPPDAIVVTSAEGLQNLIDMTDPADRNRLFHIPLAVISSRLQAIALSLGFTITPQVAATASDDGLMQALIRLFEGRYA